MDRVFLCTSYARKWRIGWMTMMGFVHLSAYFFLYVSETWERGNHDSVPVRLHFYNIECLLNVSWNVFWSPAPPPPPPLNFEICLLPFCLYRNPFRSFVDTSSFYFFSWCQFLNFWWICGTDRRFRVLNIISSRSKWIRGGVVIWKSLCTMIIKNVGMGCSQMTWEKLWSLSIIKYERGDDL